MTMSGSVRRHAIATLMAVVFGGLMVLLPPWQSADAQTQPYGLPTRTPLTGVTFPYVPPASASDLRIVRAFPNVSFSNPLYLTAAPGVDSHLYVVEQVGIIRRIANNPAVTTKPVFIDLTARIRAGGEEGLLGFAFHPQYASNGYFYVYYTPSAGGTGERHSVLSRFRRSASNPDVGDPASEQILLTIPQPYANHNGGCLQFGADGKLYIASGDGGSGNDPQNNAQNPNSLLGKMLRLNDDGSIPADNPYVGQPGRRGEIWADGLRNPWRFSVDASTGQIWVGDVGQEAFEEVDIIRRGGNYGWRVYEADRSNINPSGLPQSAFDRPVYIYPHSSAEPNAVFGVSITGGYVYRGTAIPGLVGKYLFADFLSSKAWALNQSGGVVSGFSLVGDVPSPSSFGVDNAQNVYITSFDGYVYRVEQGTVPPGPAFPTRLSETGLFADTVSLTANPGLVEYEINAPFWSDGTLKRRWFGLEGTSRIGFSPDQAWTWPAHAIVVKHFEITLASGVRKRLETRVLVNEDAGWRGYTYRWNAAETDADLLPDSRSQVELDVLDPVTSSVRRQTYEFPSRGDCLRCHTAAAGFILGARTGQLQRDHLFPNGVTDNQLRSYNQAGLFTTNIGDHNSYPALTRPADVSAALADRARAYLDSNCSQCHRPNGPTGVILDLRAATATAGLNAVNVRPTASDLGLVDAYRITPGSKERSVLWERMRRLDGTRMPPLSSHVVDEVGLALIGQWIDQMPPSPPPPTNLLGNPSFETASLSPWTFFATSPAAGSAATDSAIKDEGAYAARVTLSSADAARPWNSQLTQAGFSLVAGRTYTLSFSARADRARSISALVQLDRSPYTGYLSPTVALTTGFQRFTYSFTAPVTTTAMLSFQLAQSVGSVWIDAVSLTSGASEPPPPPPPPPATGANLLRNPNFDTVSLSPWSFYATSPAAGSATTDTAIKDEGAYSARATLSSADTARPWNSQLSQAGFSLVAGQTYTLSFSARADRARSINALVQLDRSPYTSYLSRTVSLTTGFQRFTYSFTAPASTSGMVAFQLAQSVGSVWIDAVSLSTGSSEPPPPPPPPPAATNLLRNPNFDTVSLSPWNFFATSPAAGSAATDSTIKSEGAYSARVSLSSADAARPWNAQLVQAGFNLVAGRTYTLSFSARADRARSVNALVQLDRSPYTSYLSRTVNLTTGFQRFTYSFTAPVSSSGMVAFQLAQSVGSVWIDAVTLE